MSKSPEVLKLEAELESLRNEGRKLQRTLATVAADYGDFVARYSDASERTLVEAQLLSGNKTDEEAGRTTFVLVLVDAHSHKFHKDLLNKKFGGGTEAATHLRATIGKEVAVNLPEVARGRYSLVIRVFGCIRTLSKEAAAEKVIGCHPRALAPLFAEFSKSAPFVDFVDTDGLDDVKAKVCQNFKLYAANEQCKHIFFAASGSPAYQRLSEPYTEQVKKLTLICGLIADVKLSELGLHVLNLPDIFATLFGANGSNAGKFPSAITLKSNEKDGMVNINGPAAPFMPTNLIDVQPDEIEPGHNTSSFASELPTSYIDHRIPINALNQRIDLYIRAPTTSENLIYASRFKSQHPCNRFFLSSDCSTADCKFYHGALVPEAYHCLRYPVALKACNKGGACRVKDCMLGHICQRRKCSRSGEKEYECRMPRNAHGVDWKVKEWVRADDVVEKSANDEESTGLLPEAEDLMM